MTDLGFAAAFTAIDLGAGALLKLALGQPIVSSVPGLLLGAGLDFGAAYVAAWWLWPAHPVWAVIAGIGFGILGAFLLGLAAIGTGGVGGAAAAQFKTPPPRDPFAAPA